ncbi:MAG: hypothetical protein KAX09_06390 [Candidatus Heimdallarchaeota archaeon]|nr:hypothetical protein [Candidatus Heimdallarchaeota archaeon]MCK4290595.1 hypothetical protein [Candidatus Heimdallarchaeota archaeon]
MTLKPKKQLTISIFLFILLLSNFIFISQLDFLLLKAQTYNEPIEPTVNFAPVKSSDYLLGVTYTWLEDIKVVGSAVVSDSLGNSYITGTINTDILTTTDIFIGKTNSSGEIVWLKKWDFQEKDIANDIVLDEPRNQLFVIGETLVNTSFGYSDVLVVCFDSITGEEIWNATYGELAHSEEGNSAIYYSSKIYITGTQTTYFHLYSSPNIFSACIDSLNSSLLWMQNNTSSSYDISPSIVLSENLGELFLVFNRYKKLSDYQHYRFHLSKLLLNGSLVWESVYGIDDSIKINDADFSESTDMIKLTGYCNEDENPESKDAILLSLDTSGNLLQEIKLGSEGFDEVALTVSTANNSLFIGGYGDSEVKRNQACFLSKISLAGDVFWFEKINKYAISSINGLSVDSQDRLIVVGSCKFDYDYLFERLLLAITKDSDSDGLSDHFESEIGTDPENPDSDGDGYTDGEEYLSYTDPLKSRSNPKNRRILRNFAISLFTLLLVFFSIIQFSINTFSQKTQPGDTTPIANLFEKIRTKLKIRKVRNNR